MNGRPTHRLLAVWLVAVVCCANHLPSPSSAADLSEAAAERRLRDEYRLVRVGASPIWKSPLYDLLRERHAELPDLRKSIVATQRQLDARIAENARIWPVYERRLKETRAALAKLNTDDPQRQALQQQLRSLQRTAAPPNAVGRLADVRVAAIELSNAIVGLHLSIRWIRLQTRELMTQYETLRIDPRMREALAALGKEARLASPQTLVDSLADLAEYDELLTNQPTPLYMLGDAVRFVALANETTPVTLTLDEKSPGLVLTASHATAAGVKLDASSPPRRIRIGDETLEARPARLDYLLIGRHLARDVPILVLAPEREDIGTRLHRSALPGFQLQVDRQRLRVELSPASM